MRKQDLVGGMIWLAIGIGLCIGSLQLGLGKARQPGAGFLPFFSGVALTFLALLLIGAAVSGKSEKREGPGGIAGWTTFRLPFFTLITLLCYVLMVEPLGFLPTTFLALFFLFKLGEPKRWLTPLIFSIITVLLSYLTFAVWLQCRLPQGIFTHLLR